MTRKTAETAALRKRRRAKGLLDMGMKQSDAEAILNAKAACGPIPFNDYGKTWWFPSSVDLFDDPPRTKPDRTGLYAVACTFGNGRLEMVHVHHNAQPPGPDPATREVSPDSRPAATARPATGPGA